MIVTLRRFVLWPKILRQCGVALSASWTVTLGDFWLSPEPRHRNHADLTFLLAPTLATGVKYASTHLLLRGDLSEVDGARSFCAERLMAALKPQSRMSLTVMTASQKENPHSLARSSAFLVLNSSLVRSPVSRSSLLDLVSYGFS